MHMHAKVNPDEVTFIVLKNRKKFRVIRGTFQADEDTYTFEYRESGGWNAEDVHRRMTVDRTFVAAIESAVAR